MKKIIKNTLPCSLFGDQGEMINYGYEADEHAEQTQYALQVVDGVAKVKIKYGNQEILNSMHSMFKDEYPNYKIVTA